jgi:aspartate aminotransferase
LTYEPFEAARFELLTGRATTLTYVSKARKAAEKGLKVISFGVGQPDIPTFDHIIEAGKEALDRRFTKYTETQGIPELRKAIADYLNSRYSANVSPDEIIVTTGAKTAIFVAMAAMLKPGDEVLIPEPSYPAYASAARILGAKPVFVPLKWEPGRGFDLDLSRIIEAITPRTRIIVLNNPHNPTGAVFSPKAVEELVEEAAKRGIVVLADEIYDNFIYEGDFRSVLEVGDWRRNILYVNGHSKTFSMTGWRLGWLVAPKRLIPLLRFIAENVYSCAPSISQWAGVAALRGPWDPVRRMVELFRKRRDVLVELLSKLPGFEVYTPPATFFVFPRVEKLMKELGVTVEEFVERLIDRRGVVMIPGSVFPDEAGRMHIRFSYALDVDAIREGVERIKAEIEEMLGSKRA